MKKLMGKNIVSKEWINDTYKYALASLRTVADWMERDVRQKRETLQRRFQDFSSFIGTLKFDAKRPTIRYFEGEEGVRQAYGAMLERGEEILRYLPAPLIDEEDALYPFLASCVRERRRRKIFSRVIAYDTPDGRKFQSRDQLDFRKTRLAPADEYQFPFEKAIVGELIVCFNHAERKACAILYPELAQSERTLFEKIWKQELSKNISASVPVVSMTSQETAPTEPVGVSRTTFASLLSRRSLAGVACALALSAALSYGVGRYGISLNSRRAQENVLSVAATAALQFHPTDLSDLRSEADIRQPAYARVIALLNRIRTENPSVRKAYILRPTGDASQLSIVADADSLDPRASRDLDGDGVIDEHDHLSPPGELYNVRDFPLWKQALDRPTADQASHTDRRGTFFSGLAPIRDADGHAVAMLGIDRTAEDVSPLLESLLPFLAFFVLFGSSLALLFLRGAEPFLPVWPMQVAPAPEGI
jgi:hypothetical protein